MVISLQPFYRFFCKKRRLIAWIKIERLHFVAIFKAIENPTATLGFALEAPRGIGIVNIFNVRWFFNAGAVGLQTKPCKAPIPIEVFYS